MVRYLNILNLSTLKVWPKIDWRLRWLLESNRVFRLLGQSVTIACVIEVFQSTCHVERDYTVDLRVCHDWIWNPAEHFLVPASVDEHLAISLLSLSLGLVARTEAFLNLKRDREVLKSFNLIESIHLFKISKDLFLSALEIYCVFWLSLISWLD